MLHYNFPKRFFVDRYRSVLAAFAGATSDNLSPKSWLPKLKLGFNGAKIYLSLLPGKIKFMFGRGAPHPRDG